MNHNKTLGRRQFLAKTLAVVTSAGLLGMSIQQPTAKTHSQSALKKKNIKYRILGNDLPPFIDTHPKLEF